MFYKHFLFVIDSIHNSIYIAHIIWIISPLIQSLYVVSKYSEFWRGQLQLVYYIHQLNIFSHIKFIWRSVHFTTYTWRYASEFSDIMFSQLCLHLRFVAFNFLMIILNFYIEGDLWNRKEKPEVIERVIGISFPYFHSHVKSHASCNLQVHLNIVSPMCFVETHCKTGAYTTNLTQELAVNWTIVFTN